MLLHLDKNVARDSMEKFTLAKSKYAAEHWFEHARFEGLSQNASEGMEQLFDQEKPYLAIWLWIYDPIVPPSKRNKSGKGPSPPRGTPLHYTAFCGVRDVVEVFAMENPQDVDSCSCYDELTPLHLASGEGHVEVARVLVEYGADVGSQDKDGSTPLHRASEQGHVKFARLHVERGADAAAQDKFGSTPLHRESKRGRVGVAWVLVEHGADTTA
jgi:Ankyrin repeats (3 copies)